MTGGQWWRVDASGGWLIILRQEFLLRYVVIGNVAQFQVVGA